MVTVCYSAMARSAFFSEKVSFAHFRDHHTRSVLQWWTSLESFRPSLDYLQHHLFLPCCRFLDLLSKTVNSCSLTWLPIYNVPLFGSWLFSPNDALSAESLPVLRVKELFRLRPPWSSEPSMRKETGEVLDSVSVLLRFRFLIWCSTSLIFSSKTWRRSPGSPAGGSAPFWSFSSSFSPSIFFNMSSWSFCRLIRIDMSRQNHLRPPKAHLNHFQFTFQKLFLFHFRLKLGQEWFTIGNIRRLFRCSVSRPDESKVLYTFQKFSTLIAYIALASSVVDPTVLSELLLEAMSSNCLPDLLEVNLDKKPGFALTEDGLLLAPEWLLSSKI